MEFERKRAELLGHLRRQGIVDERVLDAVGRIPRERFVPREFLEDAYEDRALPIGSGQTISQPFVVARMTELLRPTSDHRLLEVGTGSGYQTAVLAVLVREVVTIERHPWLSEGARRLLDELGIGNVRFVVGDGTAGFTDAAPYDGVLVTAAAPRVPDPLVAQCAIGGRIVAPIGERQLQILTVMTRTNGTERHEIEAVKFVPLVGRYGFREDG